jgi:hypothetical protein
MDEQIQYYVEQYRKGDQETAFHGLIELGHEATARLIECFHKSSDNHLRTFIVRVIRNYQDPSSVDFFKDALFDPNPDVWKEAMDGLVSLASQPSMEALQSARERCFANPQDMNMFRDWLEEAIQQINLAIIIA